MRTNFVTSALSCHSETRGIPALACWYRQVCLFGYRFGIGGRCRYWQESPCLQFNTGERECQHSQGIPHFACLPAGRFGM